MNILQAIVLGVVQGLTEFLPVSSDGHLAVAYKLLGQRPNLAFEVFLHGATLIAMVVYFRHDIVLLVGSLFDSDPKRRGERRTVLWIVLATAVSGVLALLLSPYIESISNSMRWVGAGFLGTAALLALGEALGRRAAALHGPAGLGAPKSLFVGALQGLAVLPGVSRSGSTIAAGMLSGMSREASARFSFLLGMPIIALAAAKDALDVLKGHAAFPAAPAAIAGFLAAAVFGYAAIAWLLSLVKSHSLKWFAIYTALLGVVLVIVGR